MNIETVYSPEDQKKIDLSYEVLANYEEAFISSQTKNIDLESRVDIERIKRALLDDPQRALILKSISDLISVMMPKTIIKLNG